MPELEKKPHLEGEPSRGAKIESEEIYPRAATQFGAGAREPESETIEEVKKRLAKPSIKTAEQLALPGREAQMEISKKKVLDGEASFSDLEDALRDYQELNKETKQNE